MTIALQHVAEVPPAGIASSSRRDLAIAANGTAYILDSRGDRVFAFTPAGQLRTTLGLTASGAKTHVAGYLIAPMGNSGVLVYDTFAGMVHAFRWSSTAAMTERGSTNVGSDMAKDLCAIGDTAYVLQRTGDRMVHAYMISGGSVRTFGQAPGSDRYVRAAIVDAGGHLACAPHLGLVIVALRASGTVYAFRPDGTPAWQFKVPNFVGLSFRTMPDSSVQMAWAGGAKDAVVSTFTISDSVIAVQVRRIDATGSRLETLLFSPPDMRVIGRSLAVPMARRVQGNMLITGEGAPSLHAETYRIRLSNGGH
ncbi:MAG TPA: hypothetical protein VFK16_04665 [Gemmatimonadaceae bacterium]|nr:hypothetical protein [Gemmatimonadaceae bacterium]